MFHPIHLKELSEQLQQDLLCLLDGCSDIFKDAVRECVIRNIESVKKGIFPNFKDRVATLQEEGLNLTEAKELATEQGYYEP